MSHVLVVGGTGMLRGVSLHLASQGNTVSVIARGSVRMNSLVEAAHALDGDVNPVQVDYRESATLRAKLKDAVKTFGPITLAVSWIHRTAPEAPDVVAETISRGKTEFRYFDILGSTAASRPHRVFGREARLRKIRFLIYRKIILGVVIENDERRWLTHEEISGGVIKAIERDEYSYLVGEVPP